MNHRHQGKYLSHTKNGKLILKNKPSHFHNAVMLREQISERMKRNHINPKQFRVDTANPGLGPINKGSLRNKHMSHLSDEEKQEMSKLITEYTKEFDSI